MRYNKIRNRMHIYADTKYTKADELHKVIRKLHNIYLFYDDYHIYGSLYIVVCFYTKFLLILFYMFSKITYIAGLSVGEMTHEDNLAITFAFQFQIPVIHVQADLLFYISLW